MQVERHARLSGWISFNPSVRCGKCVVNIGTDNDAPTEKDEIDVVLDTSKHSYGLIVDGSIISTVVMVKHLSDRRVRVTVPYPLRRKSGRTSTLSEKLDHVANEVDVVETHASIILEDLNRKLLYEHHPESDREYLIAT